MSTDPTRRGGHPAPPADPAELPAPPRGPAPGAPAEPPAAVDLMGALRASLERAAGPHPPAAPAEPAGDSRALDADQPEDETAEQVAAAYHRGPHGVTTPPPPQVEATGLTLAEGRTGTTVLREALREDAHVDALDADPDLQRDALEVQLTPSRGDEPTPEPDSGPGWHREGIGDAKGRLPGDLAAQVDALLADRDRGWDERDFACRQRDAARADWAGARAAARYAFAAVDRLRGELAEVTADRDRLQRERNKVVGKLVQEHMAYQHALDDADAARADLSWHRAAREALAAALLPVHRVGWQCTCNCEDQECHDGDCRMGHRPDCPAECTSPCPGLVDRALATARRDAAAHALEWATQWVTQSAWLRHMAAEVRAGTRTLPGTQPDDTTEETGQ